MACEKGATYLDKLCHKFYDEPKGRGEKTDYVCRRCGGPLEAYYCEERLYLVRCVDCGTLALVKTANPRDSARVTLARPTLTPPNEWVRVEERLPTIEKDYGGYGSVSVNVFNGKSVLPMDYESSIVRGKKVFRWKYPWGRIYDGKPITHWMPLPEPPQ